VSNTKQIANDCPDWDIRETIDHYHRGEPFPSGFSAYHPALDSGVLGRGATPEDAQRDAIHRHNLEHEIGAWHGIRLSITHIKDSSK